MNTETIHLNMTSSEADKLAFVLMTSLHKVSMLPSERTAATDAANALFGQLGYRFRTGSHGERIELGEDGRPVKMVCEHPGLFAKPEDKLDDTKNCPQCGKDIPVSSL